MGTLDQMSFEEAVQGLMAMDFSRLEPLFKTASPGSSCPILRWLEEGRFDAEPPALAEAFTCACFNGCEDVALHMLRRGIAPSGGINTGLNAFHWAANRGQAAVVELLIRWKAPLETRNSYGGTVLGCAVWSALHEPKPGHPRIIQALCGAGAELAEALYPSGNADIDAILKRHGAGG